MKALLTAIAASVVISGCSNLGLNKYQPYPQAQLPEKDYQDKIQAAQHWNVLAKNEAGLLADSIASGTRVNISATGADSAFGRAYRKLLTQHLIGNGVIVNETESGSSYTIDYEAQIVSHKGRDPLNPPAGILSAAAGSAWLIAQAADNWGTPGLVAIPFALAGDAYLANNRDAITPDTEVLMTTNLRHGNRIVQSSTRIYYFNPGDSSLYTPKPKAVANTRNLPVTDQP